MKGENNMKRFFALFLALVMVLSIFGCAKKPSDKDKDKDKADAGEVKSEPAVWSDTTVVSEEMYTYFFNAYYRYYLETYAASLNSLGLDPAKALSAQKYSDEYTWHQYLTLQVYTQLREMIALADAAKADGIKLSKEDKEAINVQVAEFDKLAKEANVSVDDYIVKAYGKGVTKNVIKQASELRTLANKYYKKLVGSYEFTEEDCNAYYEKNRDSFLHFDYIKMTVSKEDAKILGTCRDEKSFVDAIRQIITDNNFIGDYDRFKDTIEKQVAKKYYYRASYDPVSSIGKWLMEEGRKGYDIHTKTESSGDITVSMVLPTNDPGAINSVLYRDELPLKNVMYMVFDDSEGTEGKVKAESIYKNWQENPTADRFEELCNKYDGGKGEDVSRNQFNADIDAWVFAEDRKAGDCAIIEVTGGAYLLYMLEDGEAAWLSEVKDALAENKYDEDLKGIIDKYPTEYNSDFIYKLTEVKVSSGSSDTTAAK